MTKDKKITSITPNLQEKLRNKIAGMVDLVCRVVVESDGTRKLQFKSNEVVFGGGRLQGVKTTECPLNWDALMGVYKEAIDSKKPNTAHMNKVEEFKKAHSEDSQPGKQQLSSTYGVVGTPEEPTPEEVQAHADETPVEVTQPVRRERRARTEEPVEVTVEETNIDDLIDAEPTQVVEAPVRRTRRVRGE